MSLSVLQSHDAPRGGLFAAAFAAVLGLAAGCATGRGAGEAKPVRSSLGGFEAYLVEGGAWVEEGGLFVNRDFDFSLAMADEMVGAGVAAARRAAENRALALSLRGAVPTDLAGKVRATLLACGRPCREAAGDGVVPWGLLFGKDHVRLQAVIDLGADEAARGPRRIVIVDGESRAVDGRDDAWAANSGKEVFIAMMRAVLLLPSVLRSLAENAVPGEKGECPVSSSFRYSGRLLYRGQGWRAFALAGLARTLIVCVEPVVGLTAGGPRTMNQFLGCRG